jgi:hypothetical protein
MTSPIDRLFTLMCESGASDLHLSAGMPPLVRKDGAIQMLELGAPALDAATVTSLLEPIMPPKNREEFARRHDTDFAYEIPGLARFRANVFVDRKGSGAVFRVIPSKILTAENLGLSQHILGLCRLSKGLVLVTGPTGSGKSTTLCAMVDYINRNRSEHIIAIEDPIDFAEGGTEAIFTLPNGLFGFIIADENGLIVEDSDILLDTNQNNFRAVTSVSCSNCHAQGLIPVVDEVREIALANSRVSGLNRDEVEQLRNVYPAAAEFARIVEDDSSPFYQAALTRANVPLQGGDPLSAVFFRFDQDMRLADAAGDLGLTPEELDENLNIIAPELGVLRRGVVDRDDFTQFYVDSLCILQGVGENQPDPDLCLAVADNGGIVP